MVGATPILGSGQTTRIWSLAAGGLLTNSTIRFYLQTGNPGELALIYSQMDYPETLHEHPNEKAGVVDILSDPGKYHYNSLQVEIRRGLPTGWLSRRIIASEKFFRILQGDADPVFDPYLEMLNRLDYARADHDRTHTVNIMGNTNCHSVRKAFLNGGGVVDKIFGGWQLTSIFNISSGTPISLKDTNGTLNRTGRSPRQTAVTSQRLQIQSFDRNLEVAGWHHLLDRSFGDRSGWFGDRRKRIVNGYLTSLVSFL